MNKKYVKIIIISLFIPHIAHADFEQKVRPYVEKYLGHEISIKLFGEKNEKIKLPAIPEIEESAKSTKVYSKNETANLKSFDREVVRKDNLHFITEVYRETRKVKPDKRTVSNWMNALDQGGTREGLYRAIVLDNAYASLENDNQPISVKGQDFALYYLSTFLNRQSKKETIAKSNFYTLKRVLTEKSLEIIDEYLLKNEGDYHKWYAVFSGELAKRYPGAWDNKMRASSNRGGHLNWCQKVPIQNIKSEIILKLHKVMNFLNN